MLHKLTTEQLRKVIEAIGDGSDWPKYSSADTYLPNDAP